MAHIFQADLLSHVSVEEHPKLAMLRKTDEDWAVFAKVASCLFPLCLDSLFPVLYRGSMGMLGRESAE